MERAERRTRGAGQRELASSPLRGEGYEGVASPAAPSPLFRGGAAASAVPSPPNTSTWHYKAEGYELAVRSKKNSRMK